MKLTKALVIVRESRILNNLILSGEILSSTGPCGTSGKIISKMVINGNGKAIIDINLIKMATDTQAGVQAILDNFEVLHTQTRNSLFNHMLTESI